MSDIFCGKCGSIVQQVDDLFCTKCGTKRTKKQTTEKEERESNVDNYAMFKKRKEEQRRQSFKKHTTSFNQSDAGNSTRKKNIITTTTENNEVRITVGVVTEDKFGELIKRRGSRIPITIKESANITEVLNTALKKIAENDQYFSPLDSYLLLYPDFRVVEFIPGSQTDFTIGKYKRYLGKPFSKIDL